MITKQVAQRMSTDSLLYTRKDLQEVIAAQEPGERQKPGSCKKLGQYNDELFVVAAEIYRRSKGAT
jgi:hypothetical protein